MSLAAGVTTNDMTSTGCSRYLLSSVVNTTSKNPQEMLVLVKCRDGSIRGRSDMSQRKAYLFTTFCDLLFQVTGQTLTDSLFARH